MVTRRFSLSGLFAVLLALMAQLGMGATVPRIDPVAAVAVLCHDDGGSTPSRTPMRGMDCLLCPLCATLHSQAAPLLSNGPVLPPPAAPVLIKAELPPPATTPPALPRRPNQPRAPPIFS